MRITTTVTTFALTALLVGWAGCASSRRSEHTADSRRADPGAQKREEPRARRTGPARTRPVAAPQEHPLVRTAKKIAEAACACSDTQCAFAMAKSVRLLIPKLKSARLPSAASRAVAMLMVQTVKCVKKIALAPYAAPKNSQTIQLVDQAKDIRKLACACKTRRCAGRMMQELSAFRKQTGKHIHRALRMIIARQVIEAHRCLNKIYASTRPSPKRRRSRPRP